MATESEIRKAKLRLYTEVTAVVAAIVVSVVHITVTNDMASNPLARPDPFTGTQFIQFYEHEYVTLKKDVRECRELLREYNAESRQRTGRVDQVHRNLEESLQRLESQIHYLYQQQTQN